LPGVGPRPAGAGRPRRRGPGPRRRRPRPPPAGRAGQHRHLTPPRAAMSHEQDEPVWRLLGLLFRAHPWHGVPIGPEAPAKVNTYIEIVPTDTVKYELDKVTGLLRIDRPQLYSNVCPALYGLIPQTF